jgi:hypothetical protein
MNDSIRASPACHAAIAACLYIYTAFELLILFSIFLEGNFQGMVYFFSSFFGTRLIATGW